MAWSRDGCWRLREFIKIGWVLVKSSVAGTATLRLAATAGAASFTASLSVVAAVAVIMVVVVVVRLGASMVIGVMVMVMVVVCVGAVVDGEAMEGSSVMTMMTNVFQSHL